MSKPDPQQKRLAPIDAGAVLNWYDRNARTLAWRVSPADRAAGIRPDPYRVWLSEIMLQQTTVAAVGKYYARFLHLWPTVADLAAAPLDAVLVEWAGLGYYARARNLHACAITVAEVHGGIFPATRDRLLKLPGIGPYTAAAIAAIAFDEPVAVIDGNVERVMARYRALPVPVADAKDALRADLQSAIPARAGDFAQALMDLGAMICAPRAALCAVCPLVAGCEGARLRPLDYPVKIPKTDRPVRHGHAFIIHNPKGEVLLVQRPDKGLLAKMTGTPVSDWLATEEPAQFPFRATWHKRGHVTHVFTHFRLELDIWSALVSTPPDISGRFVAPRDLHAEALPSLFRKVLAAAGLNSK
ncbi:MAG TPA: A/G-specific adenine glycosylase [Devosia sp.]|nr:A/G-specific adenine glycosylase [Devosia sp.]